MANFDTVCYRNTCLKRVLVRLDFLNYIETHYLTNDSIAKAIKMSFPNKGMDQLVNFSNGVSITPNGVPQNGMILGTQFTYFDNNNNQLIISNKVLLLQMLVYDSFDKMKERLIPIINLLFQEIPSLTISRFGIRYVNVFNSETIKPLKKYFLNDISSAIEQSVPVQYGDLNMARRICLAEYQTDDMKLNFRYGYYNPDYPQPLKKNDFTLDFDSFKIEPLVSYTDVLNCINNGHLYIQQLFENSISDALREELKNGQR